MAHYQNRHWTCHRPCSFFPSFTGIHLSLCVSPSMQRHCQICVPATTAAQKRPAPQGSPKAALLEPPSPTAWPPLICFPSLLFWHLENLIQMESYSRWAFEIGICHTVLFTREFIQVGPCTLLNERNIHGLDVPLAISPIKGHLGYYHIWVIRNKATTQSW